MGPFNHAIRHNLEAISVEGSLRGPKPTGLLTRIAATGWESESFRPRFDCGRSVSAVGRSHANSESAGLFHGVAANPFAPAGYRKTPRALTLGVWR